MKKLAPALLLLGLCWGIASADQLYIYNKPYKGQTSGSGAQIQAQLKPLVEAMGLQLSELSGNYVITAPGETAALPEGSSGIGHIYFEGKPVGDATSADAMVSVKTLAEATGSAVRPNKAMHLVDVNHGVARIVEAPDAPKRPRPPAEAYVPPSKYKVVAFDADW